MDMLIVLCKLFNSVGMESVSVTCAWFHFVPGATICCVAGDSMFNFGGLDHGNFTQTPMATLC